MENILGLGIAFLVVLLVHYFSNKVSYDDWRRGNPRVDYEDTDRVYYLTGKPSPAPFYKKVFQLVVLAIIIILFVIAGQRGNFKTQQIILTMLAFYGFFWFFVIFNVFVVLRNRVNEALGDIDTQLSRRKNLIGNIIEMVKQYASHEAIIFESMAGKEPALAAKLMAVAEKYPDLKASDNFLYLQKELSVTEYLLQDSRSYYNDCVSEYNTQIELIPAKIIARVAGFKKYDFFKAEKEDRTKIELQEKELL